MWGTIFRRNVKQNYVIIIHTFLILYCGETIVLDEKTVHECLHRCALSDFPGRELGFDPGFSFRTDGAAFRATFGVASKVLPSALFASLMVPGTASRVPVSSVSH